MMLRLLAPSVPGGEVAGSRCAILPLLSLTTFENSEREETVEPEQLGEDSSFPAPKLKRWWKVPSSSWLIFDHSE
jgi:hypothetical protein